MPWDEFYSEYNTRLANEYPSISALSEPWQNRNVISPYKIYPFHKASSIRLPRPSTIYFV